MTGRFLSTPLPFLRCFGAKLSTLNVEAHHQLAEIDDFRDRVGHYINKYCTNTLAHITYNSFWKQTNPQAQNQRPFENISSARLLYGNLTNQLPNCLYLFPNLRYLCLENVEIDVSTIVVHFPHLKELFIASNQDELQNEFARKILHANPQLQSVNFWMDSMTLDKALDMMNGISALSILDISCGPLVNVDVALVDRLVSEHTLIKELFLPDHLFTVEIAVALISQLNLLERFCLSVRDVSERDRLISQLGNDWKIKLNPFFKNEIEFHRQAK